MPSTPEKRIYEEIEKIPNHKKNTYPVSNSGITRWALSIGKKIPSKNQGFSKSTDFGYQHNYSRKHSCRTDR